MTLHFSIEYHTDWGQSVEVELCFISSDGKTHYQRIPLETDDGSLWKGLCMLKARGEQFRYTYFISHDGEPLRKEWDVVPRLFPADNARTYFFIDHWRDVPADSYCYTDAYQVARGKGEKGAAELLSTFPVALFPRTFLFRVQAPQLVPGERVALVGDQPALGNWDVARALPMTPSAQGEWLLSISADGLRLPFEYKYITAPSPEEEGRMGRKKGVWEEGPNRQLPLNGQWSMLNGQCVVALSDGEIRLKPQQWKSAGLVVPLFSLKTEGSQGIGDFGDLKEIAHWAAKAGMHAIQLLPIYDTTQGRTFTDSYPYNAISVHALHPIYADLRQLPLADKKALASFQRRWKKLNALPAIDYEKVIKLKEEYLHKYYEEQKNERVKNEERRVKNKSNHFADESNSDSSLFTLHSSLFNKNSFDWLQPYCVFCHLRDTYDTPRFASWPELSIYNRNAVAGYIEAHSKEVGYYAFVQHILHKQLAEAAAYAHSLRVFLKGDLPIGISPYSVEAWHEPHLFHMDMVAGAPPDDFSRTGQNWGFPTYDWERMAADGYLWWRQRLGGMAQYFSAYRIDHILGFFRIWSIPKDNETAMLGHFSPALPMSIAEIESYGMQFHEELFVPNSSSPSGEKEGGRLYHPRIGVIGEEAWRNLPKNEQDAFIRLYEDFFFRRHNDFWAAQAMKKLPALISASNMLVCGEDLGMVPACVGPVMQQLGILSLEIQAMPKTYGIPFAQLHQNPYRSVDTIFTHDMPTLRLWWKENAERTQLFYNTVMGHEGKAPKELSGKLCEEIVAHHLDSPSMLCLISLQDWLSIDESLRSPDLEAERINVPSNPKNYWRYRMHLPISKLTEAKAYTERLHTLIVRSGR